MNSFPRIPFRLLEALMRAVVAGAAPAAVWLAFGANEGCAGEPDLSSDFSLTGWAAVGNGTTGGQGGSVVVVSTPEGLVSHLARPEPLTILVHGPIDFREEFPGYSSNGRYAVASDKTIFGIGSDAGIYYGELSLNGVRNIIIRNLTFAGAPDTAIGVRNGTTHVWIDHNHLSDAGDGLIDITRGSDFVTVSWNRFSNHIKTGLVGAGDEHPEDPGKLHVTYHHNWFDQTYSRHPRVRFGKVHAFNNFYDHVTSGIQIGADAQIVSEHNFFEGAHAPWRYQDNPEQVGYMKDTGSLFVNTGDAPPLNDEGIDWSPGLYYAYSADQAENVPFLVRNGAGVGVVTPDVPVALEPAGLIAYYPLTEGSGNAALDQSGFGEPLDLHFTGGAEWLTGARGIRFTGGEAKLRSTGSATKLFEQLTLTRQFSIEIWARPAQLIQAGPARLVSYSKDTSNRNFTWGHGYDAGSRSLIFRLRTTGRGDADGLPHVLATDGFINGINHYVCAYDGKTLRIFRNGESTYSESREGAFDGWDEGFPLVVGNEATGSRGWVGEMYSIAIFDRALSQAEIRARFDSAKAEFIPAEITNFDEWLEASFPEIELADPRFGGIRGDPYGRGVPNLIRYALRLDPRDVQRSDLPGGTLRFFPETGEHHLSLTYRRRRPLEDVEIFAEGSTDFRDWERLEEEVIEVSPDGHTKTIVVQDPVPMSQASRRFLRVRARLLEPE